MKQVKELDNINFNKDNVDLLKKEYISNLKDDNFKLLVKNINLTEDELIKYTSKLKECSIENSNCLNCNGLFECKNIVKGYRLTPIVNDYSLSFSYEMCHFNEQLKKENKYQDNIYYFDIPKEIREAKISEIYTKDKNRTEIIIWIKEFFKNYLKDNKGKGLYLNGSFGSGKTYIISALFNELAKKNYKVAIVYWPEFLRSLKASFETNFDDKFSYIKKIPLLLIDDIGAENLTPWARDEILGSILQYRMQEGLTTFFTSNLNLEELEIHFSNTNNREDKVKAKRIMERIKQLTTEMSLISKNNRQ